MKPTAIAVGFQVAAPVALAHQSSMQKWLRRASTARPTVRAQAELRPSSNGSCETSVSRRALLLSASTAAVAMLTPAASHAYSSPYKPNMTKEKDLPQQLYDPAQNKVVTTASGLRYFELMTGTGAEATDGATVFVYYTSRLAGLNGIKIQSTFDDPAAPPFIFRVGAADVVPGVSEAVRGMRVGGKRRAVLPPAIGYASPDMRPQVTEFFARRRLLSVLETSRDASIAFDFELIKVK